MRWRPFSWFDGPLPERLLRSRPALRTGLGVFSALALAKPMVPRPSPRAHLLPGSPSAAVGRAQGAPPLVGCQSGRAAQWVNWDADGVTQSWSGPPRGETLPVPSSKCKVLVQRGLGTSPLLTGVRAMLTSCPASQPQLHC